MAISPSAPAFIVFSLLLISVSANDNPADKLVDVINKNRTTHRSSKLADSPGLGCIALQYIKAYEGQCDQVDEKAPKDSEFAETFAPNCGVQASTLAVITGRLLGCQSHYVAPSKAFSDLLIHDSRSLEILYSRNHTQVGAAVSGTDGGAPYFWCVLFSRGSLNNTFALDGGKAKTQRPGCFSGTGDDCSDASSPKHVLWSFIVGVWISFSFAIIL